MKKNFSSISWSLFGKLVVSLEICYIVNVSAFLFYIVKGNGDALIYIQEVLEIGAYRTLLMALPALISGYCPFTKPREIENGLLNDSFRFVVYRYVAGGVCAAIGFIIFAILLRMFLPPLILTEGRINYINSRLHADLYLNYPYYIIIAFHGALIFMCGGYVSVMYVAIGYLTQNKYIVFLMLFVVLQCILVFENILKFPAFLKFSNVFSGCFTISTNEFLNILWAQLLCFIMMIPWVMVVHFKRKESKYAYTDC